MRQHLADIEAAGITHIVDNRIEWSDEDFVRTHAPQLTYTWNGQDDAGQRMPDEWFSHGVEAALEALATPNGQVLVHCHMGINRGPLLAFALLLATGHEPVAALAAIRQARPIAAIGYSRDALDWWHRETHAPTARVRRERAALRRWHRENPIDVVRIIHDVRAEEEPGAARPA